MAFEFFGAFGGKGDGEWFASSRHVRSDLHDGREVAAHVRDFEEARVWVGAPRGSVVEEVEASVGAEDSIDGTAERECVFDVGVFHFVGDDGEGGGEGFDGVEISVGFHLRPFNEGALPIPEKELAVMVLREPVCFFEGRVVMEDGSGARGAAPFPEDGKLW